LLIGAPKKLNTLLTKEIKGGAARSANRGMIFRKKFTIPTNLAIPFTSPGQGKFLIASVLSKSTDNPAGETVWPKMDN
jgi:hypothetical protein